MQVLTTAPSSSPQVLRMRFEARHEGREVWRPPALYELIDAEVEDEHTRPGEPQWRTAHVRRVLVNGRFQVCLHRPDACTTPRCMHRPDQSRYETGLDGPLMDALLTLHAGVRASSR